MYFKNIEQTKAKLTMGVESMGRTIKKTVLVWNGKTYYPSRQNFFKIVDKGSIYRKSECFIRIKEGRYLMFDAKYKIIGIVNESDLLPEFEIFPVSQNWLMRDGVRRG